MRKVFKYTLEEAEQQALDLPVGAELLSVGYQNGQLRLWALVDPDQTMTETHRIRMAGTGHPLPDGVELAFLGRVGLLDGALILHFFEELPTVKEMVKELLHG
jgi:hypothetical protein